jgi:hypothetical protein
MGGRGGDAPPGGGVWGDVSPNFSHAERSRGRHPDDQAAGGQAQPPVARIVPTVRQVERWRASGKPGTAAFGGFWSRKAVRPNKASGKKPSPATCGEACAFFRQPKGALCPAKCLGHGSGGRLWGGAVRRAVWGRLNPTSEPPLCALVCSFWASTYSRITKRSRNQTGGGSRRPCVINNQYITA